MKESRWDSPFVRMDGVEVPASFDKDFPSFALDLMAMVSSRIASSVSDVEESPSSTFLNRRAELFRRVFDFSPWVLPRGVELAPVPTLAIPPALG